MFQQIAQQLVRDFYSLLKRYVDNDERARIKEILGYNAVSDQLNDQALLKKLQLIYSLLQDKVNTRPKGYYSYSGIDQYFEFLEKFLSQYCIYSGRVVHRAQRLSGLMLHIIQLMEVPQESFTSDRVVELRDYCIEVIMLGSEDYSAQLKQLLKQHIPQHSEVKYVLDDLKSLSKPRDYIAA